MNVREVLEVLAECGFQPVETSDRILPCDEDEHVLFAAGWKITLDCLAAGEEAHRDSNNAPETHNGRSISAAPADLLNQGYE